LKSTLRSEAPHFLKSTWVFKLKRLSDGTPSKFKARFCERGDLKKEGVDFFETYAPLCQWSTLRMILTMVLQNGWATKQVDYTNAFAQAEIMLLLKSLYGLKQAPRTFYEKLRDGLLERGFTKSEIDPFLFLKKGCICVVYVADTIFAGPDAKMLEQ
jgi:hypothetical protein